VATNKARGSALCSQVTQWCAQVAVDRIGDGLRHAPETMPAWNAAVGKLGMLRPQRTIEGRNEVVANVAAANSLSEEVKPVDGEISPEAESIMRDPVCNEESAEDHHVAPRDAFLRAEQVVDASCTAEVDTVDEVLYPEAEGVGHDSVCIEESVEIHDDASPDAKLDAEQVMDALCEAEADSSDEKFSPEAENDVHDFVCDGESVENPDFLVDMEDSPEELASAEMPVFEVDAAVDRAMVAEQESEPQDLVESDSGETWLPMYDELSGHTYYCNVDTGATSWTLP
jgi:hypothetical protein